MNNLIPMAGAGSLFCKEGYSLPKPLIEVSGKPMVIQASDSLPLPEKWIYICRDEHIREFQIDQVLKGYHDNVEIVTVDHLTEGQACTCLLAKEMINNEEQLMIAASDNGMIWNREKFEDLKQDCDCLVWTFRGNNTVVKKPQAYGWIECDRNLDIKKASVKVPISQDPINDHAIVGTFWFRKGKMFVDAAQRMISQDRRVNGEFYVDEVINDIVEMGLRAKVFEIEKYICWGTPDDLRKYQYWESYFE